MRKAHIHAPFQPGSHLTGDIGTEIKTLVARFEGNTLIIQIAGGKEILVLLSATGYIQIEFGTQSLLFHGIKVPKGPGTVHELAVRTHRLRIVSAIRVRAVTHQLRHQIFRSLCGSGGRRIVFRILGVLVA